MHQKFCPDIDARDFIRSLFLHYPEWTVRRTLNHLNYTFDKLSETVIMGSQVVILEELKDITMYHNQLADSLRLSFWGGPPGQRKYYDGTLFTLLLDCYMSALAMEDADKVDKFIAANTI